MIKVIFSDFDNTMLDYYSENNYFDEYKLSILSKIRKKGIKFCIVTGRSIAFFNQFPNLLENIDYIMGSNGACIYDVINKKFILQDIIEKEDFDEIIGYLMKKNYSFAINCKDKRFKYGNWNTSDCLDFNENDEYLCEQIVFETSKEDFEEVFNYLEVVGNARINNIACWQDGFGIDINDRGVSKGNAIKWLCNYLDVDINDAIAFGDGDNDVTMFEAVNKGVAVGNAVDKLKVLAKEVTLDCHDNGIYKYIEENILK